MVQRVSNPPNPWQSVHAEWLGEPPEAALEVYEEEAKSIIASNDSPDIGFEHSVNPYRGCFHACAYCYCRPTHQYLGFGAGTDFDRKIVVKTNAPELLRRELTRKSWKGGTLVFSGVTDCYQPLEAIYGLTRRCLETCLEFRNPVGIVTKGALIRRDADVLAALAREADVTVYVSIPFWDHAAARALEPNVSTPSQRVETLAALSAAGIRTGVSLAPVIPGLNDGDMAKILAAAREAGAHERLPDPASPAGRGAAGLRGAPAGGVSRPRRSDLVRHPSGPRRDNSPIPASAPAWRGRGRGGRRSRISSRSSAAVSGSIGTASRSIPAPARSGARGRSPRSSTCSREPARRTVAEFAPDARR